MNDFRSCVATLASLLPLSTFGSAQAAPAPAAPVRLEVRVSPIVDLYYELRTRATEPEAAGADDLLAPATGAARALDRELGWILAWGPLDGRIADCKTAT